MSTRGGSGVPRLVLLTGCEVPILLGLAAAGASAGVLEGSCWPAGHELAVGGHGGSSPLDAARRELDRVEPARLAAEVGAGALVVDTRPTEQRRRDGALSGAV